MKTHTHHTLYENIESTKSKYSFAYNFLFMTGLGVGSVTLINQIVETLVELRGKLFSCLGSVMRLLRLGRVGIQFLKAKQQVRYRLDRPRI